MLYRAKSAFPDLIDKWIIQLNQVHGDLFLLLISRNLNTVRVFTSRLK